METRLLVHFNAQNSRVPCMLKYSKLQILDKLQYRKYSIAYRINLYTSMLYIFRDQKLVPVANVEPYALSELCVLHYTSVIMLLLYCCTQNAGQNGVLLLT